MPAIATRQLELKEVDSFLGNGWFMGLGPEQVLVAWGSPKKSKKPTTDPDSERLQFFIPDFYLSDKTPWVSFENTVVAEKDSLIRALTELTNQPKLGLYFESPAFQDFQNKFELVKSEIQSKKLRKAVPVVFSRAQCSVTKAMRAGFILNLLNNAKKPTPYGYLTPTEGILGASPEILFSYDAPTGRLNTMALAGTRQNEKERENSLENDPKEMFEHDLVIQGLKDKLAKLGDLSISPTYVWDIGRMSHLRTDLTLEFDKKPAALSLFMEMNQLLHPTAALGVSPMTADWRFLKQCDGAVDRRRFGAPFGVFNPAGRSVVLVAIRAIQWQEDQITLGTGCGVVEQSELQNEWQELELKRNTICSLLGLQ